MSELDSIFIFTKVVEANGFSAAAQLLGMSPSAVSRQISALEDNLGVRLLNRSTRRLSLTHAGDEFHQRCSRGLADIEEARNIVTRERDSMSGALRVAAPQGFGRSCLAKLMPEFLALYPDIQVNLLCGPLQRTLVDDGLDVLIRTGVASDTGLAGRKLAHIGQVTCASPKYLEKRAAPQRPRDLPDHSCLIFANPQPILEWPNYFDKGKEYSVSVSGNFQTDSLDALYQALLDGVGIARTPSYLVGRDLRDGVLMAVFDDRVEPNKTGRRLGTTMNAYFPRSRQEQAKAALFVDFLVERFRDAGDWSYFPSPAEHAA